MPITLSGTRINITYEAGDTRGGSWASPYRMEDIVAASDANGWNPAVQRFGNLYIVPYSLWSENFTTYFTIAQDVSETIFFNPTSIADNYLIYLRCDTRIGKTVSSISTYGGQFNVISTLPVNNRRLYFNGDIQIINSTFTDFQYCYIYGFSDTPALMQDCFLNKLSFGWTCGDFATLNRVLSNGGSYNIVLNGRSIYNNLILNSAGRAILSQGLQTATTLVEFRNIKIFNSLYSDTYIRAGVGNPLGHTYVFIDSEIDKNKMVFYVGGTIAQTNYQILKSTLTANVIDMDGNAITNAEFKLYDKDNNEVINTILTDGSLPATLIKYFEKYIQVGGSPLGIIAEGETDYTPFKAIVTKDGYDELIMNNINITNGIPTYLKFVMFESIAPTPPVYYQDQLAGAIETENLSGVTSSSNLQSDVNNETLTGILN